MHVYVCVLVAQSCPTLCDPMDYIAHLVPLSMEFSRQEYPSGLPFPSPGDRPNPGIEARSPTLQADSLLPEPNIDLCPLLVYPLLTQILELKFFFQCPL